MYVDELGINDTHSLYQFLPLAHVLARVAQAVVIRAGARACFWSGDPARIIDELAEFAPTHFPAVPRIYEKIHGAVIGRIDDGPAAAASAVSVGIGIGHTRPGTSAQRSAADRPAGA